MKNLQKLEKDARSRAKSLEREASRSNAANLALSILVPLVIAVAAGLTTTGYATAGGLVGILGTALTAGYAGWAPGRRADRDWVLYSQLDLLAGQASDLRAAAVRMSIDDAADKLSTLRRRLATAVGAPAADVIALQ